MPQRGRGSRRTQARRTATTYLSVGLGVSLLLLILSLALSKWSCGTILHSCLNGTFTEPYQDIGSLLVGAIVVNFIALSVAFIGCAKWWAMPLALILTWIDGTLAVVAIAFYFTKLDTAYCPLLAISGSIFAVTMSIKGTLGLVFGLCLSFLGLIPSVVLSNWSCGTLLNCCVNGTLTESYKPVGGLLFGAILVNCVALPVAIAGCVRPGAKAVALVLTWLGGILGLAAIAYYFAILDSNYSPLLAVIGMTVTLAMAFVTTITIIQERIA
ncbi:unnamed protein product [Dibothriocephalus latus]|uniref:Uncharacterized protein n=1 Tax=Dibothriocephalus latus TaxID=60516 RepID=A0A3P7P9D8_DIBLA|nr:unnamed protein product [Dibothriocephalus latus]